MPGARRTRSLVCEADSAESTRVNHRYAGRTRHSLRNGFTTYGALSPVSGLLATVPPGS